MYAHHVACVQHTYNGVPSGGVYNTPIMVCIWRHAQHTTCGVKNTPFFLQCRVVHTHKVISRVLSIVHTHAYMYSWHL